jgi:membrane protein YdbS with pleckstrin-like domain
MPTIYNAQPKKPASGKQSTDAVKTTHPYMKPLAAFALQPGGVRFETQEEQETVELFLRQHPIVNLSWLAASALLLAAPTVIFPVLFRVFPQLFTIPAGYIIVGTLFWYVVTFGFILTNFLHWFFNIYIVTNERIVDIDFYYLLYKHFSEAELTKIQDISFTSSGMLATLFDYGDVVVETAGELPTIDFAAVPHPERIVETIRSLAEHAKNGL